MEDASAVTESQTGLLLTPEGYESLQQELEHLTTVKRPEIADRIRESLQHGEFSEDNSELDQVKSEQAMVENRIAELKGLFGGAQTLDPDQIPTDHVGIGSYATLEDTDFGDQFEIRLVISIESNPDKDLVSNESPMGTAIFGHSAGEVVEVSAPDGLKRYKIKSIRK